jgi:hypothetical protein
MDEKARKDEKSERMKKSESRYLLIKFLKKS